MHLSRRAFSLGAALGAFSSPIGVGNLGAEEKKPRMIKNDDPRIAAGHEAINKF
jgi:hypothetical protein